MNNFLISGFGRSGTGFLSKVMNRSKKWTVLHEPRGGYEEDLFKRGELIDNKILTGFDREYYGEVNSRMRFYFNDIDVSKKGLILRDPKQIITSSANRNTLKKSLSIVGMIHEFWFDFHDWLEKDPNIVKIEFSKMVSDVIYLKDVLNKFDIDDVEVTVDTLNRKVNKNKSIKYKNFDSLPDIVKKEYEKLSWNIV